MATPSASSARVAGALARLGLRGDVREMPESTRSAAEAAAALGCDVAQILKSLVFRAVRQDAPVLVLASGADRVDESKLAAVVGGDVERASGAFVRARTGYAIGGVPPVGHDDAIAVYVDERVLAHERVWAAAGTPRSVFTVSPADLVRATGATVVDVADA